MRTFREEFFTVFDLEATGGPLDFNGILEIALIKIRENRLAETFSTLVNPKTPISPFVRRMTGITDEMIEKAPTFPEIAEKVALFIDCDILVVHNGPFDLQFLNFHLNKLKRVELQNPLLCTVKLGERLLPLAANRRLETLAEHLGIPLLNRHRALSDTEATAKIFLVYLKLLEQNDVRSLVQLVRWMRKPVEVPNKESHAIHH